MKSSLEFKLTKAQKVKIANRKHNRVIKAAEEREMKRKVHLKWCKDKAIAVIKAGDPKGALVSFEHNMRSNVATHRHIALSLIPELTRNNNKLNTTQEIQNFIEGFN